MKIKSYWFYSLMMFLLLITFSVNTNAQQAQESSVTPNAALDFSRIALIGDSLSQSNGDGVLHENKQRNSYAALFAKQVGTQFNQVLIKEPGGWSFIGLNRHPYDDKKFPRELVFPARFILMDPTQPIVPKSAKTFGNFGVLPIKQVGVVANPEVKDINNFAVSFSRVGDAIKNRPSKHDKDSFIFATLGNLDFGNGKKPLSALEHVEAMNPKPTTVIVFIGAIDAALAPIAGDSTLITPPDVFRAQMIEITTRVKKLGAKVVLATMFDTAKLPFLMQRSEFSAIFGVPEPFLEGVAGLRAGDAVKVPFIGELFKVLQGQIPAPLPEPYIARREDLANCTQAVNTYNKIIFELGKQEGAPVVDFGTLYNSALAQGIVVPGVSRLSRDFFGGFADFDGVHLTLTSNAIVANLFIDTINKFTGSTIPMVDVVSIAKNDPQIPKNIAGAAQQVQLVDPSAVIDPQTLDPNTEFDKVISRIAEDSVKIVKGQKPIPNGD